MHIAFSSDDNYAQHLGVTIASLLSHLKPGVTPSIYVIDGGISFENKEKIASLRSIRDFNIDYLTIDPADFAGYPLTAQHKSVAIYFRLKLPDLLPHLDKILYLDIDIVIEDDLTPLYETPIQPGCWLAAVFEPDLDRAYTVSVGMKPDDAYFNSGVMVLDLSALRTFDFQGDCRRMVQKYHGAIRYLDQDVLNVVCRGHVQPLHPRYNLIAHFTHKTGRVHELETIYDRRTVEQAIAQPAIIHFLGKSKPWMYRCYEPFAEKYGVYLKQTPWRNYRYPDKTIRAVISKWRALRKRRRRMARLMRASSSAMEN